MISEVLGSKSKTKQLMLFAVIDLVNCCPSVEMVLSDPVMFVALVHTVWETLPSNSAPVKREGNIVLRACIVVDHPESHSVVFAKHHRMDIGQFGERRRYIIAFDRVSGKILHHVVGTHSESSRSVVEEDRFRKETIVLEFTKSARPNFEKTLSLDPLFVKTALFQVRVDGLLNINF